MGNWKITYIDAEGIESSVEVPAVNKFMAYDMFTDIIVDMYGTAEGIQVISANRIIE